MTSRKSFSALAGIRSLGFVSTFKSVDVHYFDVTIRWYFRPLLLTKSFVHRTDWYWDIYHHGSGMCVLPSLWFCPVILSTVNNERRSRFWLRVAHYWNDEAICFGSKVDSTCRFNYRWINRKAFLDKLLSFHRNNQNDCTCNFWCSLNQSNTKNKGINDRKNVGGRVEWSVSADQTLSSCYANFCRLSNAITSLSVYSIFTVHTVYWMWKGER